MQLEPPKTQVHSNCTRRRDTAVAVIGGLARLIDDCVALLAALADDWKMPWIKINYNHHLPYLQATLEVKYLPAAGTVSNSSKGQQQQSATAEGISRGQQQQQHGTGAEGSGSSSREQQQSAAAGDSSEQQQSAAAGDSSSKG